MIKHPLTMVLDYLQKDFFIESGLNNSNSFIYKYVKNRELKESFVFGDNAKNLKFNRTLINNASEKSSYDNRMVVIQSKEGFSYLIYSEKSFSLCVYNLTTGKMLTAVINAHSDYITLCKKYKNKDGVDLILTAGYDYAVKLWKLMDAGEINNKGETKLELILTINNAGLDHGIRAGLIVDHPSNDYFIVSCSIYHCVNLWNSEGKIIQQKELDNYLFTLETWKDKITNKHFIIIGNDSFVSSLHMESLELYKNYSEKSCPYNHFSVIVTENGFLFETDRRGVLRMWDFHSAMMIKKIKTLTELNGLCIWSDKYVVAGATNARIILFNIQLEVIERMNYKNLNFSLLTDSYMRSLDKIIDPVYGACLLTYSNSGLIDLWTCI